MNIEQTARIIGEIALYDNRRSDAPMIAAWHRIIGELSFEDTMRAVVDYFGESSDYLKPADLKKRVKVIRDERLKNADLAIPAADPKDTRSYTEALRDITKRIADGRTPFRAIEGARRAEPSTEYRRARSAQDNDRVLAQTVPCPVDWCRATVTEPCIVPATGQPHPVGHPSRLKAARAAQGAHA